MFKLNEIIQEIKKSDKPFYVYMIYKPNGAVFYVGKGRVKIGDQRIAYHEREVRGLGKWERDYCHNKHKINTIKQIWKQGHEVHYTVDSWHETEEVAYARETELIASIGRCNIGTGPLTNLTDGGEKEMATASEETREQISQSLKEYYQQNPDKIQEMSERNKKWFEDHPEAIDAVKANNEKNKNHEHIINWLATTDKEVLDQKYEKHSEYLKEWHQTEEGKETTKKAAIKRNEKIRTDEHRKLMAEKTAKFIRENPEADKARRQKVAEIKLARTKARQLCWNILRDNLISEGKIKPTVLDVSSNMIYTWKKNGIIPEGLIPNGNSFTVEQWDELAERFKNGNAYFSKN